MTGIDLFWDDNDPHLVRWKMHAQWNMGHVQETNAQAMEWFAQHAPDPVYVIVDLSDSESIPRNFISGVSSVSRNSPDNWVMTVIVGSDALIQKLFEIGFKLDGLLAQKYAIAHSIDEARQLIEQRRRKEARNNAATD